MRKSKLALVIGALAVSGTVMAQPDWRSDEDREMRGESHSQLSIGDLRQGDPVEIYSRLDADANGELTLAEAEAMNGLPQQFPKFDLDGDGSLSEEEFTVLAENSSGMRGLGNNDFMRS